MTTPLSYEGYFAEYGGVWIIVEVFDDFEPNYSTAEEFTSYRAAADRADEIEAAGHTVNRTWK